MTGLLITLLVKGLAVYYLAGASVILFDDLQDRIKITIRSSQTVTHYKYPLRRKPFNCQFCMSFWWFIPMFFIPFYTGWVLIPAGAGVAVLLWKLEKKLDMFEL